MTFESKRSETRERSSTSLWDWVPRTALGPTLPIPEVQPWPRGPATLGPKFELEANRSELWCLMHKPRRISRGFTCKRFRAGEKSRDSRTTGSKPAQTHVLTIRHTQSAYTYTRDILISKRRHDIACPLDVRAHQMREDGKDFVTWRRWIRVVNRSQAGIVGAQRVRVQSFSVLRCMRPFEGMKKAEPCHKYIRAKCTNNVNDHQKSGYQPSIGERWV
ncbi:hypothetical protein PM082_010337 [Marasmius tenuissimus]|nr:hypothetical protein PM082_010337 [Marasmius tenuissimus]